MQHDNCVQQMIAEDSYHHRDFRPIVYLSVEYVMAGTNYSWSWDAFE